MWFEGILMCWAVCFCSGIVGNVESLLGNKRLWEQAVVLISSSP